MKRHRLLEKTHRVAMIFVLLALLWSASEVAAQSRRERRTEKEEKVEKQERTRQPREQTAPAPEKTVEKPTVQPQEPPKEVERSRSRTVRQREPRQQEQAREVPQQNQPEQVKSPEPGKSTRGNRNQGTRPSRERQTEPPVREERVRGNERETRDRNVRNTRPPGVEQLGQTRPGRERTVQEQGTRNHRERNVRSGRNQIRPVTGNRRSVQVMSRDRWKNRYDQDKQYTRRHIKRRDHIKQRNWWPRKIHRPKVYVDINWPWPHRQHHNWWPTYVYQQTVRCYTEWGHGQRRRTNLDIRTRYYHKLRHANNDRAEVDIFIESIEIYENNRYLGRIDYIPERMAKIRATVYRDGGTSFDRDVFIVGDYYAGFELISTRYYDDYLLNSYRPEHNYKVARLDLYRRKAYPMAYSRLFNPGRYNGYVPVSLLPEDSNWLLDYGNGSFSGSYYDADPYYYGGYKGYDDDYDEDDYYEEDFYEDNRGRPHYSVRSNVDDTNFVVEPLEGIEENRYTTDFGAQIEFRREVSLVRTK